MDYPILFEIKYHIISNFLTSCIVIAILFALISNKLLVYFSDKYNRKKDDTILLIFLISYIGYIGSLILISTEWSLIKRIPIYKEIPTTNSDTVDDYVKGSKKVFVCYAENKKETVEECIKANRPQKRTKEDLYEIWRNQ